MPRILVLNMMHLDEWPPDQVANILESLKERREIIGFTREAPGAGWKMRRGYEDNITDCFPGSPGGNREQRDAWQITQLARETDLVLDIHGTRNGWDFPFYGAAGRASPLIMGTASLLGCERAAILGAPHPAGVLHNYVGWDLSPDTTVLTNLRDWLNDLASGWIPPVRPMAEYRHVDGIREVDALRLGLSREYPPLARLPDKAIRALGLPTPAYAFSWGADLYRHTGYWGEVAVPYREPGDKPGAATLNVEKTRSMSPEVVDEDGAAAGPAAGAQPGAVAVVGLGGCRGPGHRARPGRPG